MRISMCSIVFDLLISLGYMMIFNIRSADVRRERMTDWFMHFSAESKCLWIFSFLS